MRPGVYVGDDFFYEKSSSRYEQDASNYIEQTSDHEFTVVSHDKKQEVSYEIEKEQITFYFPDQTVTGSWDTDQKELYDNGVPVLQNGNMEFSEDGVNISQNMDAERYSYALCRIIYDNKETISTWYMNILGLFLYILVIPPCENHIILYYNTIQPFMAFYFASNIAIPLMINIPIAAIIPPPTCCHSRPRSDNSPFLNCHFFRKK